VHLLYKLKDLLDGRRDVVTKRQGQIMYDVIYSQFIDVIHSLKKSKVSKGVINI